MQSDVSNNTRITVLIERERRFEPEEKFGLAPFYLLKERQNDPLDINISSVNF